MKTDKSTVKTITNFINSFLVILILVLSIVLLILPDLNSIPSLQFDMILTSSILNLIFSVIFLVLGVFIRKDERLLTNKERRNFFIFNILAVLATRNISQFTHPNKLKTTIKRQWNAPGILIACILLLFVNLFTALIVADSELENIITTIRDFNSSIYSQLIIAQIMTWILLVISSFIWYSIDIKSRIQVPEHVKDQNTDSSNNISIQCAECSTVFKYNSNDGICPVCGKYSQPSDSFTNENNYKNKKSALEIFKTIGMIILIFAGIIIVAFLDEFVF